MRAIATGLALALLVVACGDDPDDAASGADTHQDDVTDTSVADDTALSDASGADTAAPTDTAPADTAPPADIEPADVGDTATPTDTGPADTTDTATPPDTEPADTTDAAVPADTEPADTADTAASDTATADTAEPTRQNLILDYCPSQTSLTPPGYYKGTTAGTNDFSNVLCVGAAGGADGALRVEVPVGATLTVTYTSTKDGVLFLLKSCPVLSSCLAGADATGPGGAETITWTNTTGAVVLPTIVLDNDDDPDAFGLDGGPFTLDVFVTP